MAEPFKRNKIFGREPHIQDLMARARQPGLTALVARPKMGKTWTLNEVARRLSEDEGCLVGYHESKGAESSHLRYAVEDLYVRWLSESALPERVKSLLARLKGDADSKVGKTVSKLIRDVSLESVPMPKTIREKVRAAIGVLTGTPDDLKIAGQQLGRLDYHLAEELTTLVCHASGRRVVLILDAWEKVSGASLEHKTLDAVLRNPTDWSDTHIFLGIRRPELDDATAADAAFRKAEDFAAGNPHAEVYPLPAMALSEQRKSLIAFLRQEIPAAASASDEDLLAILDGFPGTLEYWLNEINRASMQTLADLKQVALDAQKYRYREFDVLLSELSSQERTFSARLACLPRLNEEYWDAVRDALFDDIPETVIDDLLSRLVLENKDYPSFGHDTRHAAARRWFAKERLRLTKAEGKRLVWRLARKVTSVDDCVVPFVTLLAGCGDLLDLDLLDAETQSLVACSLILFRKDESISTQNFNEFCKAALERDISVLPLFCMTFYNRGVRKGQAGDSDGAIADYTAVVELPDAPSDLVAKALYNRGYTKAQAGDCKGAIADCTAVIELPDAPSDLVAEALNNRGVTKGKAGDSDGEIADYTAVIKQPDAPSDQVAKALYNRGVRKGQANDSDGAIADCTAVIKLPDAPSDQIAKALANRGAIKGQRGDEDGAMEDLKRAIEIFRALGMDEERDMVQEHLTRLANP